MTAPTSTPAGSDRADRADRAARAEPPLAGARAGLVLLGTALAVAAARLLRAPSEALYLAVVARTGDLPGLDAAAAGGVLALLVLLGAVAAAGTAGRGRSGAAVLVTAALGVGASAGAYLVSEGLKGVVRQPRGCWDLAAVADCPARGDWSFPSNHTTVAVALAVTVALTAAAAGVRWATSPAVLLAVLVAGARVAQGAHLPHDVLAGAVLGAGIVLAVVPLLRGPAVRALAARAG
jgi:undecaprenyl-diphosphatase